MFVLNYKFDSVPTVRRFILSNKRYKYLQGPVGSGKSSGCVMHLFKTMVEQAPGPDGVRRTRYAIIRNTARMLDDTTKKTIEMWIPSTLYTWRESKRKFLFNFKLDDGTVVESEWLMRALDEPEQIRDLLSLELTGAWLNEGREIDFDIFSALRGRIGRYPSKSLGGPTYTYIIIDSNPPNTEHWLYKFFVEGPQVDEELAELVDFFKQPSGRSPYAENKDNLPEGYYENLMVGQDEDFIRVYIDGEFGIIKAGKAVFTAYKDSLHYRDEDYIPKRGLPIYIGMDFGLYPACVFTQYHADGSLHIFDEVYAIEPMDLETFVNEKLIPKVNSEYMFHEVIIFGDPAGQSRSQVDGRTCYFFLRQFFNAYPAYTNSLHDRIRAVNYFLTKLGENGKPAFALYKKCQWLRKALIDGYRFKKLRTYKEMYSELPEKNEFSHIADALQYVCLAYMPSINRERLLNDNREFFHNNKKYSYESFI